MDQFMVSHDRELTQALRDYVDEYPDAAGLFPSLDSVVCTVRTLSNLKFTAGGSHAFDRVDSSRPFSFNTNL